MGGLIPAAAGRDNGAPGDGAAPADRCAGADESVLLARAYLSRVAEPAQVPLWAFVHRVGPVAAAAAVRTGTAPPEVLAATDARRREADPAADLEVAERCGIRLVVPESDDWPHFAFAALHRAALRRVATYRAGDVAPRRSGELVTPLALWARGPGELAGAAVRSVGIVGARAATPYGEHVTLDLAHGLARRAVTVVSGGAYGIDAAAHRGALAAGGDTVVVSAAGLDRPYPAGNAGLYEHVAETGLVLSESPPGVAPHRGRFLTRNRLIAALSTGTVVVEAARRSGAANTAKHCADLGRPLMAVPGPVTSAMSAGCHSLLRRPVDPALLVTGVEDVLDVVGGLGEGSSATAAPAPVEDLRAVLDDLDPAAQHVFEGVPGRRPARPDEIARRCGIPAAAVIRALPVLVLAGLVECVNDEYRLARQWRPGGTPDGERRARSPTAVRSG